MYAVVASPSSTLVGPLMLTVIGSLATMVAVAALAPFFKDNCDDSVEVIAASVTVKDSAPSESVSSVAVTVMVWVAPAALFAAKVTVPDVAERSDPSAASVASGALHATWTSASTALDSVTVKVASLPSDTLDAGPEMDSSAESLSTGSPVVVLSSSVNVTVAELTLRLTVVVPGIVIVSSPSTIESSVGVMVRVPVPLDESAGMVMLAREVAV